MHLSLSLLRTTGTALKPPVVVRWIKKLGTGAKPKGKGTGWAKDPSAELAHMPPDEASAEARSRDIHRTENADGN